MAWHWWSSNISSLKYLKLCTLNEPCVLIRCTSRRSSSSQKSNTYYCCYWSAASLTIAGMKRGNRAFANFTVIIWALSIFYKRYPKSYSFPTSTFEQSWQKYLPSNNCAFSLWGSSFSFKFKNAKWPFLIRMPNWWPRNADASSWPLGISWRGWGSCWSTAEPFLRGSSATTTSMMWSSVGPVFRATLSGCKGGAMGSCISTGSGGWSC